MTDVLQGTGYRFDSRRFSEDWKKTLGKGVEPDEQIVDIHEVFGAYAVTAFNAGRDGRTLTDVFPWLIKEA